MSRAIHQHYGDGRHCRTHLMSAPPDKSHSPEGQRWRNEIAAHLRKIRKIWNGYYRTRIYRWMHGAKVCKGYEFSELVGLVR